LNIPAATRLRNARDEAFAMRAEIISEAEITCFFPVRALSGRWRDFLPVSAFFTEFFLAATDEIQISVEPGRARIREFRRLTSSARPSAKQEIERFCPDKWKYKELPEEAVERG